MGMQEQKLFLCTSLGDKQKFLRLAETKLENFGYKCYFEEQKYTYMGEIHSLETNEVMVAVRKMK